eukprot:CAMPEP_0113592326 /NCGR_PEP_ID=MMETSP0015_2-20120614/37771_1 /TAXON_ID=2838 /ORGANISM="Odontella" /LENGTH=64 /DNA_ID=CAMNT_0000498823 /DNA_START=508 /DNA_END=702 /DNA_ORIENTATION=+ /assembly_acc=CAM_ASM_000160
MAVITNKIIVFVTARMAYAAVQLDAVPYLAVCACIRWCAIRRPDAPRSDRAVQLLRASGTCIGW